VRKPYWRARYSSQLNSSLPSGLERRQYSSVRVFTLRIPVEFIEDV
jgi:hypothetical protein